MPRAAAVQPLRHARARRRPDEVLARHCPAVGQGSPGRDPRRLETRTDPPHSALWREAVCIASGPSLTADDCDLVRRWRSAGEAAGEAQAGEAAQERAVVVVNTTFRLAPWADALFAMDENWWKHHHEEVAATFTGRRTSTNQYLRRWGVEGVEIPQ